MANQTSATFLHIMDSKLIQKYLEDGSKLVYELFRVAKEHVPSIVFINKIDAIKTKREIQRTILELLNQLDGFDSRGDAISVVGVLQDDTNPMVSIIKLEKAPTELYTDIGDLEQQIQGIKKSIELFLIPSEHYEKMGIKPLKGLNENEFQAWKAMLYTCGCTDITPYPKSKYKNEFWSKLKDPTTDKANLKILYKLGYLQLEPEDLEDSKNLESLEDLEESIF
ncbi:22826_t:CDS:2 [Cetraspora pellucida]|uniref:22826_t:CDS:1 n=1 Tax=Cetraspora pellucida TaxID=1433469 RepID=A0A9N9GCW5_9GLOM|nr:22826_t:CDS:2 [Cetraspora pellucida]